MCFRDLIKVIGQGGYELRGSACIDSTATNG